MLSNLAKQVLCPTNKQNLAIVSAKLSTSTSAPKKVTKINV